MSIFLAGLTCLAGGRPATDAAVAPFNDTIFSIHAKLGPYSPGERAVNITARIRELTDDAAFTTDSLTVKADGSTLDIVYRDIIVMSLTDADTLYMGGPKEQLAEYYRACIAQAVDRHREETGWLRVLTKIGLVMLIAGLFVMAVRGVGRLFLLVRRRVVAMKGSRIKGISFKTYNLLDAERATGVILFAVKIVRYIIILLLFYLAVTLLFSVFPETRGLAGRLLKYVTVPLAKIVMSIVDYVPKAITIVLIVFLFRYLIRGVKYFAGEIEKEKLKINGFYPDWAMPTYNIIRTLLYAFMFILIFPYLPKSDSKIFQGVSVFIGIIVSLGSTSLIGNLVAGLVLTYMRPFKIGDNIRIGDMQGTVMEKTPFVTRLRTLKNEEVTIPNAGIMSAFTVNYTNSAAKHRLILYTTVTFGYETPWRRVHELLLEAAGRTAHVLHDPKPFVQQRALDDFYAEYQINVYTVDDHLMMQIYSELYQHIQDVFREAGIELTSPHYRTIKN
jgi:small-conductance mechanosensitive channel